MMKTLAGGLAVLQAAIYDTHLSGSPERRRALFGTVEHFQEDALGPIRPSAAMTVALEILRHNALAYSRTRQAEQKQRDSLFEKMGVDLAEVAIIADRVTLDEEAGFTRPDYDASPVPNPIRPLERS